MDDLETLDFRELERELANALAADQKYSRENDAKFRAIHQKVASYEEFRDIVLASNLKPLERKDKVGGESKQPWNPSFNTTNCTQKSEDVMLKKSLSDPTNAFEFARDWRRLGNVEKYDFLLQLGAEKLSQLFHAEVCSGLLGEFLLVLSESFQAIHVEKVLKILQTLAETKRFDLNLIFISRSEVESSQKLFGKLQTCVGAMKDEKRGLGDENLRKLMACYKISC
ncbi:coiled-coil domain-containing protein 103 isoform X2 [Xenopus tropicalis]|uniref:Dynein axonemal assembly factor 19 n=2 Tax=Xenopus tropicalis TaxID=8364 RepID=DAA19_XENTR|nr:coiled-coil domain-containing protein 103 [Xenopus tropicalis]XP_012827165.1 coiled-coil domain-containing protein 103 isoform X2 [Xenopus tropicalis]Q5RJU3.2 RecName: Full=Coiled-coil domain-containing protein 103 [Xenopus tropicalis]AAI35829.1 ccdc103 protein [Xenopus tropicalis]CAJ82355.1 novel protein [Xenopus tropicalis]|eukprot:XP_012827165.1 PREDICTED: coiled-coil domain-containing protein 103 isoform X2 [Xenopus tropicalis]